MCSILEAHRGAESGCVPGPVQRLELGGVSGWHPGSHCVVLGVGQGGPGACSQKGRSLGVME